MKSIIAATGMVLGISLPAIVSAMTEIGKWAEGREDCGILGGQDNDR